MNLSNAPKETGDDAFDDIRVSAPSSLIEILEREAELNQDRFQHDAPAANAADEIRHLVEGHVDRGPGILVLTGFPADEDRGKRALLAVSRMLGEVLPQNREGALVREVRDRGTSIGEGTRAKYSDSRHGGSLHTDGAESPLPVPDMFTLFCVRQSRHGGSLDFVHVRDLEKALSTTPDAADVLRSDFYFDRRGDQGPSEPPATRKSILFVRRGHPSITYMRSYVERGHDHPGIPSLTEEQRNAMNVLDDVIASGEFTRSGKLREGELALFDNLSLLHGRTEFHDDPQRPRLLLRTWIRISSGGAG